MKKMLARYFGVSVGKKRNVARSQRLSYRSKRSGHRHFEKLESRLALAAEFLRDINEQFDTSSSDPQNLVDVNGVVFFSATVDGLGTELWRTDGTTDGTYLVKDINVGTQSSSPKNLVNVDGMLYFTAITEEEGEEVWRSDGTTEGTVLVSDIVSGRESSIPSFLTAVDGLLFFSAYRFDIGYELWMIGSDNGDAQVVKDIRSGRDSGNPYNLVAHNGLLYFTAVDTATGSELWRSDGTSEGTFVFHDLTPGPSSSSISGLISAGNRLYFNANYGGLGMELWSTDGTPEGTELAADLSPGGASSFFSSMTAVENQVVFVFNDGVHGRELWKSDGTRNGTGLLCDIRPGSGSSNINRVVVIEDKIFVSADDGVVGTELWKIGLTGTTDLVKDINFGASGSFATPMANVAGALYFLAFDGVRSRLWKTDGTSEGTIALIGAGGAGGPQPSSAAAVSSQGKLIFTASDGEIYGEPWVSDGTSSGTFMLLDIQGGTKGSDVFRGAIVDGHMLFGGNGQLWQTDGTTNGTSPLRDFKPNTPFAYVHVWAAVGPWVVFSADDNTYGSELWRSDGTEDGTAILKDINPGNASSSPANALRIGNQVFFTAYSALHGNELWRTDGTEEGTYMLADILPGTRGSNLSSMTDFEGTLFFFADDANGRSLWRSDGTVNGTFQVGGPSVYGNQLVSTSLGLFFGGYSGVGSEVWRSDGTAEGTYLVRDIYPGVRSSFPVGFAEFDGKVYFAADDGSSGSELWVTDGSEAGTYLFKDITPGLNRSSPSDLYVVGGRLLFTVFNEGGNELWSTDGTSDGTTILKEIRPGLIGARLSGFQYPSEGKNIIVFMANDGVHGEELWISDGTNEGTRLLADVFPGGGGSSPRMIGSLDSKMIISALGPGVGQELWTVEIAPPNIPPSDIALTDLRFLENLPTQSVVAKLRTIDQDSSDPFEYSLIDGDGSADNSMFTIVGDQLLTNSLLDFESKSEYRVRIRTRDSSGGEYEKAFTLQLTDLPELVGGPSIADDTQQRSFIDKIVLRFDGNITIAAGAFNLIRRGSNGGQVAVLDPVISSAEGFTIVTLRFTGGFTRGTFGALLDGYYQLTIDGSKVTRNGIALDSNGDGITGESYKFGDDEADKFFALYGDINGDGLVGIAEFGLFRSAFGATPTSSGYNVLFDYDGFGIGVYDFGEFRNRFGKPKLRFS